MPALNPSKDPGSSLIICSLSGKRSAKDARSKRAGSEGARSFGIAVHFRRCVAGLLPIPAQARDATYHMLRNASTSILFVERAWPRVKASAVLRAQPASKVLVDVLKFCLVLAADLQKFLDRLMDVGSLFLRWHGHVSLHSYAIA